MATKGKIKTGNFLSMLKRVYLGGIIDEVLLTVEEGYGKIEAVDLTNSMIVVSEGKILSKGASITLGLGNLEILVKFLSSFEGEKVLFEKRKNKFIIKRSDSRRRMEYLLSDEEMIATRIDVKDSIKKKKEKKSPKKKIKGMMRYKVELNQSFIKDFLTYIGFLKTKNLVIKYDSDLNKVVFICGSSNEHQFRLIQNNEVESITEEESSSFDLRINGEFLSKVFSVIEFSDDELPILYFAKDKPIVVESKKTVWSLIPMESFDDDVIEKNDMEEVDD